MGAAILSAAWCYSLVLGPGFIARCVRRARRNIWVSFLRGLSSVGVALFPYTKRRHLRVLFPRCRLLTVLQYLQPQSFLKTKPAPL